MPISQILTKNTRRNLKHQLKNCFNLSKNRAKSFRTQKTPLIYGKLGTTFPLRC